MSDLLLRAYSRLKALRSNVNDHNVAESYIIEYHQILDQIEASGANVKEFRIEAQHLKQRVTSWNRTTGHTSYSRDRYVQGTFFRSKLDAILMYFGLGSETDEKQREVGFTAP